MSQHRIVCEDLWKSYDGDPAVKGVDLEIAPGELLTLVGPSGCGKTTLLRLLAGFETPEKGKIAIGPRQVAGPGTWVAPESRRVGMVFQDFALFPHQTVAQNVAYGLPRKSHRQRQFLVEEMLELVGLEGTAQRLPHELSGGQQQRVALARALAPAPEILLLDEPFSNLDPDRRAQVREEVREILRHESVTALLVTHDQNEALTLGDRVAVMNLGRLEQLDRPEGLYEQPASRFVARFIGLADFLEGKVEGDHCQTEIGACVLKNSQSGPCVEVVVRPDDLMIYPTKPGGPSANGVILGRNFQGTHYLYRVRLHSRRTVHVLASHCQRLEVHSLVEVRIEPGHPLVGFPINGVEAVLSSKQERQTVSAGLPTA